jgi:single-stranded DNA-binding protein
MVTVDVYKTKDGDWKERAERHRVTVWGEGTIKHLEKHGSKGALIDVLGQIRTRKWTADGVDRYSTEIVADFRAGGEVKITTLAKASKETVELDDQGDRGSEGDMAA